MHYELIENKVVNIIMVYVEKGSPRLKLAGQTGMLSIAKYLEKVQLQEPEQNFDKLREKLLKQT